MMELIGFRKEIIIKIYQVLQKPKRLDIKDERRELAVSFVIHI